MPDPALVAYALACLLALAPPSRRSAPPGWEESEETYRGRLAGIAEDIGAVSRARVDVAALAGVAVEESGLSPDVDAFRCYVPWGCDGGTKERPRAIGLWQLHATSIEEDARLRSDRRFGAALALKRIWHAMRKCAALPADVRLVGLLGSCRTDEASLATARKVNGFVLRALAVKE